MTVLILKNCKRNHLISCSLNEWTWKNITERQMEFWKIAHTICNLHLWYNFALLLQENALVFSQSEACNFLMYIIKHCNNLVQVF